MITIRPTTSDDRPGIRYVYLQAFPHSENQAVADLALEWLDWESTSDVCSLVAEDAGNIIGHIAFSRLMLADNDRWAGYILAPLAVAPACQRKGIGAQLIQAGFEFLADKASAIFVYGDPAYYGRFGFSCDMAAGYQPPYPLQFPEGWQVRALEESSIDQWPVTLDCLPPLQKPALW